MQQYVKVLLPIFFACLIFSCKKNRAGVIAPGSPTFIQLDSGNSHQSFADHVEDIKVIALQTKQQSVLSGPWAIQKVLRKDNKYFILDGTYSAIKVFDTSGQYLYDIGSLGVKADQFIKVEDIVYSPYRNSFFVLCNQPNKLAEFSLDGHFIRSNRLDFFAHALVLQDENTRIFYTNHNKSKLSGSSNILITDSTNTIKTKMFEMPKNLKGVIKISGGLFAADNDIYFTEATSPLYYQFHHDTATPVYKIGYGTREVPSDIQQDNFFSHMVKYGFQYPRLVKNIDLCCHLSEVMCLQKKKFLISAYHYYPEIA